MTFNQRVYRLVQLIPSGKVLTYGRVAALLDTPRGARAVGWALNGLPANTDVPWHRVVNANRQISPRMNDLSGDEQRRRLEAEGLRFDDQGRLPVHAIWTPSPWEIRDKIEGESDC